jgi:hypothetical protein
MWSPPRGHVCYRFFAAFFLAAFFAFFAILPPRVKVTHVRPS